MDSLQQNNKLHIFLVSFPGQGHVNPLLRLGKILASKGMIITFCVPELIGNEIRKANKIDDQNGKGLISFEFLEDEWDAGNGSKPYLFEVYMNHLDQIGRRKLPEMLKKHEGKGTPVSCLINNPFMPWVSDVAESLQIPSATLWVQSCASFSAYYHYHHSLVPFPTVSDPEIDVQLPGMPLLKYDEIPSFLHPGSPYSYLGRALLGQFKNLSKNFCILMDTVYELEHETIDYMSKLCPVKTIGPMFRFPTDLGSNVSGDMVKADDCKEWLDSKPVSSVVYISFGSIVFLKQEQVTEMAYGILNSGVNFLWVLRPPVKGTTYQPHVLPDEFLGKSGDKGKVVQWSQQVQVLAHPSIACFITHCGWNSTIEALASAVPVLTFPQWGDQVTDARFLVEELEVGVRLSRGEADNRLITRDEVERCVREITTGPKAVEIKKNAQRWKRKVEDAVAPGGSSELNVVSFLDEVSKICTKNETQV